MAAPAATRRRFVPSVTRVSHPADWVTTHGRVATQSGTGLSRMSSAIDVRRLPQAAGRDAVTRPHLPVLVALALAARARLRRPGVSASHRHFGAHRGDQQRLLELPRPTRQDPADRGQGSAVSTYVDRAAFEGSLHGKLACTSCHLGFKPGVHDASQTAGWLMQAKLTACSDCHADQFSMYRGSFHGTLVLGHDPGKAPVCADCHSPHDTARDEHGRVPSERDGAVRALSPRSRRHLPRRLSRQGLLPRPPQRRHLS